MAILNYTTKIDSYKTLSEIQQILAKNGASKIMIENDANGNPVSLSFAINWNNSEHMFRLPSNRSGVLAAMIKQKVPKPLQTEEQALRVAWRILKDWVEAQMAIKEAEIASIQEIFLPYYLSKNGKTLYQNINEKNLLLE